MASVSLERVTCTFRSRKGEVRAVNDLDLTVADGEFLALVGPSGCGKTTTLRMIAGLQAPTGGWIRIGDRVVNDVAPRDRDVAMVFQNFALYPHMSVFQNLAFPLRMRGRDKGEVRAAVEAVAAKLDIAALLDRRPGDLSGGEKQRVALGRAMVRRPKVFLLDEPLADLDPDLRAMMRAELRAIHRESGATVIHVTHDQEEAMSLGDRIAVMNRGVLQQVGRPLEVYNEPANRFVAGFIGSPPMNFCPGEIQATSAGRWHVGPCGRVPLSDAYSDVPCGPAVLGIRPQHVGITDVSDPGATGRATIRSVQPLGDRTDVYLETSAGERLTARTSGAATYDAGQIVGFTFHAARVHLFAADGEGRRIASVQVASGLVPGA